MKQGRILWMIAVPVWLIGQTLFAQVGLNLGSEYGMGMIARIGNGPVALEAGAGVNILFVGWQIERYNGFGSSKETYLKFYFPGTFGGKLDLKLSGDPGKDRLGLKFGATYSTVMKTGYGGGISYTSPRKSNTLLISGGVMIFPDADDELLQRLNEEENTFFTPNDVSAVLLTVQPFVSISILW